MIRNAMGWGCQLSRKDRYDSVRFNVICITRGWVGFKFPGKKHYITLEWPLTWCCAMLLHKCFFVSALIEDLVGVSGTDPTD